MNEEDAGIINTQDSMGGHSSYERKRNRKFDLKFKLEVVKYASRILRKQQPESLTWTRSACGNGSKRKVN